MRSFSAKNQGQNGPTKPNSARTAPKNSLNNSRALSCKTRAWNKSQQKGHPKVRQHDVCQFLCGTVSVPESDSDGCWRPREAICKARSGVWEKELIHPHAAAKEYLCAERIGENQKGVAGRGRRQKCHDYL